MSKRSKQRDRMRNEAKEAKKALAKQKKSSPALFTLRRGDRVEIRKRGERRWNPHTIQKRVIHMRTTKRVKDTVYMEFLNFEVRYTSDYVTADTRFRRY